MSRFEEVQRFPIWADLLMVAMGVVMPFILWMTMRSQPGAVVNLIMPPLMLILWLCLFRMKTEVDQKGIKVTFGWIPTYKQTIALSDIVSLESVTYNALREYGGWGIRGIPVAALNAQGNQGVRLQLQNGRKLLIGSQNPSGLASAIQTAKSIRR